MKTREKSNPSMYSPLRSTEKRILDAAGASLGLTLKGDYRLTIVGSNEELEQEICKLGDTIFPQERLSNTDLQSFKKLGGAWAAMCPGEIFLVDAELAGNNNATISYTSLVALIHEFSHLFVVAGTAINDMADHPPRSRLLMTRSTRLPPWHGGGISNWFANDAPWYIPCADDGRPIMEDNEAITHFMAHLILYEFASGCIESIESELIGELAEYNLKLRKVVPGFFLVVDCFTHPALEQLLKDQNHRRTLGGIAADLLLKDFNMETRPVRNMGSYAEHFAAEIVQRGKGQLEAA